MPGISKLPSFAPATATSACITSSSKESARSLSTWTIMPSPTRRDVARFMVKLERTGLDFLGSIRALDRAVEAFIKTYVASGGEPVAERLPFYKAHYYLKYVKMDLTTRDRGLHERAEVMLDEGLRTLE